MSVSILMVHGHGLGSNERFERIHAHTQPRAHICKNKSKSESINVWSFGACGSCLCCLRLWWWKCNIVFVSLILEDQWRIHRHPVAIPPSRYCAEDCVRVFRCVPLSSIIINNLYMNFEWGWMTVTLFHPLAHTNATNSVMKNSTKSIFTDDEELFYVLFILPHSRWFDL